jgi:polyhydroxybutyrate depolymerase
VRWARFVAALVAAGAVAVSAAACGPAGRAPVAPEPSASATPTPGTVSHTVTLGGTTRRYAIHVPVGAGTVPMPLVIQLHGGGGNDVNIEKQTGFYNLADRDGFLVASPAGTGGPLDRLLTWNAGWCCGQALAKKVDDVAFISAVVDDIEAHYPVDARRVYVTGFSNGAMMTYRLACALAGRLAAVASVSGALDYDGCAPSRPVPFLEIHGTADANVPYNGGKGLPEARRFPSQRDRIDTSVADSVGFWVKADGCPAQPATYASGSLVRTTFAPCAEGSEVVLDTINGGVHAWPGGKSNRSVGEPADAINATAEIWAFFTQHALPGAATSVSASAGDQSRPAAWTTVPPVTRSSWSL